MKIYNSATRQKEEFKTIEPGKVRMYTCGPTVKLCTYRKSPLIYNGVFGKISEMVGL